MGQVNFNKLSVQTKGQTDRDAINPHPAGLAPLASEIIRQRFGSVVVIEGEQRHRKQLAQALADQMGYRIDLGQVTSKYIGETEKNLESLFAGANHPRSILFFDEADALFGSRTEVKDAHDRYANLFREVFSFQGLLMIGVESRHSVPTHLVPRFKTVSVRDHWPPR
jgi:ATPase family protein associated with various cellular activities (AAA)